MNCNNSSSSKNARIFCIYLITSTIISIIIYCGIASHVESLTKIETLETDVKNIFKELSEIARNAFKPSTYATGSNSQMGSIRNANGYTPNTVGSSDSEIEELVKKHTDLLKADLAETKKHVDQLMSNHQRGDNGLGQTASDPRTNDICRTDFALESLGAQVAAVNYTPCIKNNYLIILLGLATIQNEPRNVLNPSMKPGDCYAFKGSKSAITIKLMTKIFIDSVTVSHIVDTISPSGDIKSAPKDFSVYGLKSPLDKSPFNFGSFTYDISIRKCVQVFHFKKRSKESYNFAQFKFTSNNGHENFTCVYRLSVHGRMDTGNEQEATKKN